MISNRLRFRRKNILKQEVPNKPGVYRFYNDKGQLLYIGHASKLRHRVQSYHQKDDFQEHPTKKPLRKHIHTYSYSVMPKNQAMMKERNGKHKAKYNML